VQILGQRAWARWAKLPRSVARFRSAYGRPRPSACKGSFPLFGGGVCVGFGFDPPVKRCLGVVGERPALRRVARGAPWCVLAAAIWEIGCSGELSGGQLKRVLAVLLCGAGLVGCWLLDEAEPGLECTLRGTVPAVLLELRRQEGWTCLAIVSHDLACVGRSCNVRFLVV